MSTRLGDYYIHTPSGLRVRALRWAPRGRIHIRWPLGGESEVAERDLQTLEEALVLAQIHDHVEGAELDD